MKRTRECREFLAAAILEIASDDPSGIGDGANARAAGERQHEGPGHRSIGRKFVLKACQLLQAEFEGGKLVEVAVHGRDDVDEAQGCEGSALPAYCEDQPRHDDRGGAVAAAVMLPMVAADRLAPSASSHTGGAFKRNARGIV